MATDMPSSAYVAPAASAPAQSAVAWGAIWAGAAAALATAFVLGEVAVGIGYGRVAEGAAGPSPAVAGAVSAAIEVLALALGGYLAGRLRTVWIGLHVDESHFRDTAHGLVVWAVSTLAALALSPLMASVNLAQAVAAAQRAALNPQGAQAAQGILDSAPGNASLLGQSPLFIGIGLVLGAFVAAVAAAIGGLRHEEMHRRV